ncbi:hypothetical protein HETIRDRAFT_107105 [Heterobasidion irregulare TC 32-1]|uniref:Uncharacterized protein n=1 Tax=Heterobasidion irregulare (strain TC 32-1) TaxID=747525 RepID=W4KAY2_HETIT|nr:uncharacterized protein HETIRDRAFT_107105 [Heterobasidion irregulare TC 32-1]ETW82948.1 hypothetical protein HETIRDRAFT_107105 [Heterobasidion irregulare TC 32-1]
MMCARGAAIRVIKRWRLWVRAARALGVEDAACRRRWRNWRGVPGPSARDEARGPAEPVGGDVRPPISTRRALRRLGTLVSPQDNNANSICIARSGGPSPIRWHRGCHESQFGSARFGAGFAMGAEAGSQPRWPRRRRAATDSAQPTFRQRLGDLHLSPARDALRVPIVPSPFFLAVPVAPLSFSLARALPFLSTLHSVSAPGRSFLIDDSTISRPPGHVLLPSSREPWTDRRPRGARAPRTYGPAAPGACPRTTTTTNGVAGCCDGSAPRLRPPRAMMPFAARALLMYREALRRQSAAPTFEPALRFSIPVARSAKLRFVGWPSLGYGLAFYSGALVAVHSSIATFHRALITYVTAKDGTNSCNVPSYCMLDSRKSPSGVERSLGPAAVSRNTLIRSTSSPAYLDRPSREPKSIYGEPDFCPCLDYAVGPAALPTGTAQRKSRGPQVSSSDTPSDIGSCRAGGFAADPSFVVPACTYASTAGRAEGAALQPACTRPSCAAGSRPFEAARGERRFRHSARGALRAPWAEGRLDPAEALLVFTAPAVVGEGGAPPSTGHLQG